MEAERETAETVAEEPEQTSEGECMSKVWSKQESDTLNKMLDAGATMADIAKVLTSRTEGGIKNRIYKIGRRMTQTPEIDFDAFQKFMKSAGKAKCL